MKWGEKRNRARCSCRGEVQELALEELFVPVFPSDLVEEVGKGGYAYRSFVTAWDKNAEDHI